MKKFIFAGIFALAFIPNLEAQMECSVNGYVGADGTSCLYIANGCMYKVTHHRLFFGLFKWNTEEKVHCSGDSGPGSESGPEGIIY